MKISLAQNGQYKGIKRNQLDFPLLGVSCLQYVELKHNQLSKCFHHRLIGF